MYFSQFTLTLIEEVKKREILYNTKYDKRPKPEKEEAWRGIAEKLKVDSEKCKKHWKNVRDRFVKIMHQRNRHFALGGSELDAPHYIYFDKLAFMTEFSIKKEIQVSNDSYEMILNISPDRLIYEKVVNERTMQMDYTDQFLENVRKYPILYDENAEMRKYRSKEVWKTLTDHFGKFSVGKLRNYWITLVRKYKLYLEGAYENIENEDIFEKMSFVKTGADTKNKQSSVSSEFIFHSNDDSRLETHNSKSYFEELDEEFLCEEIENNEMNSFKGSDDENDTEYFTTISEVVDVIEETEEFEEEAAPKPKRIKTSTSDCDFKTIVVTESKEQNSFSHLTDFNEKLDTSSSQKEIPSTISNPENEFLLFGRKVGLKLQSLANRNVIAAQKAEIQILQIFMNLEESLES
ncbi:CLUMA_CG018124, isoform A [Clunio marinus]|uniref:CLUMA_CG018124, isoform A n=1 Tax=Clunio marinus TaxID=568069 RepID=A0A1J1J1C0_9DIPT|nr:CLUMA_CG018124, isoform A [Clunio marinus]